MKAGGNNPHDGSAHIVQNHPLADNIFASAEFALPQAFSDHHSRVCANAIFISGKCATQDRIDTENLKKTRGNHFAVQTFWFAVSGKLEPSGAVGSHACKGGVHPLPVFEVWIRDGAIIKVLNLLKH